jgi:hypothetical protein
MNPNFHSYTFNSIGDSWARFNPSDWSAEEARKIFDQFFPVFPWDKLPNDANPLEIVRGAGRLAKLTAPWVGHLHCIYPPLSLVVARFIPASLVITPLHLAPVEDCPFIHGSQCLGFSLGLF